MITLDSAVNMVPKTMDRKVKAGSPSSRVDTMNFETSAPEFVYEYDRDRDKIWRDLPLRMMG